MTLTRFGFVTFNARYNRRSLQLWYLKHTIHYKLKKIQPSRGIMSIETRFGDLYELKL